MKCRLITSLIYSLLCLLFFNSTTLAAQVIEWNPEKLKIEQMQGTQKVYVTSIKVLENIQGAVARVVPELQPWVTISPSCIGDISSGKHFNIKIAVNLSPDDAIGTFEGVVQLRQAVAGKPYKTIGIPLPIELTITELVDHGLPPDPGEAGKQTLLGIDSDEDGVRDDIQRFIYFKYPDEKNVRLTLNEVAKQYQLMLLNADDKNAVFNNATKMARHGECLDYLKGRMSGDIINELHAEILNTRERSRAYITFNNNLAGEIILGRDLSDWKNSCSFDLEEEEAGQ